MNLKSIYYKIRPMAKIHSGEKQKASKITIGCISIVAICMIAFFVFVWLVFGDHSSFDTGLDSYKYLPNSAHDITVYTNLNISGMFLCDFAIKEKAFKAFAEKEGWKLEEIKQSQYLFLALSFHEKNTNKRHQIKNGLFYQQVESNGGGIRVGYDRDNGRGYISSSSR